MPNQDSDPTQGVNAPQRVVSIDVRALRQRLGMTQPELAEAIGCHWKTVQNWELGRKTPHGLYRRALERLAEQAERQERRRAKQTGTEGGAPSDH
jgi:DNA-binding transcriptional regulator YiaG